MAIRPWTLRTVAGAALVVALAAGVWAQPPAPAGKQAAVVNGEPITLAEVDAILKARPIETMKLTAADYRDMRKEAVNMLIDERIMQQFFRKNVPEVPTTVLNKKFKELQDALKGQGQTLEDYYRESGQTEAELRNSLATTLQMNAYLDKHLNEAVLRKYYEDNRDVFDEVTVRVSHILLRLKAGTTAAEREEIQNWLLGIRLDILNGKLDFAEAARKYSQDRSAPQGGDLGFIARKGAADEAFARTAFALKPNEISNVVQTASGLHLVKVTERKAGSTPDFKTLQPRIRQTAADEMLSNILERERLAAQVKVTLGDDAWASFAPGAPRK
jgi:parvulin-like peptidyl-prolyl isomerase